MDFLEDTFKKTLPTPLAWILFGIGLYYLTLRPFWSVLSELWMIMRKGKNLKKYGAWAVVTGATDGIGLGFAKQLAKQGLNLVLISRTAKKLDETAESIRNMILTTQKRIIEIRVIAADLSSGDSAMYDKIKAELQGLDIGVLVNNAGRSYDHAEYFHLLSEKDTDELIEFNVRALSKITAIVLPGMVNNKRGAVVNIGSAAGLIPAGDPLYAVYAGTKAYVDFFSRSLDAELRGKGVHVQCCVPYFVVSKLSKIRRPSLFTPTPDNFARAAVAAIGGDALCIPYWTHRLQHYAITSLPDSVARFILMRMHSNIRAIALKKKGN